MISNSVLHIETDIITIHRSMKDLVLAQSRDDIKKVYQDVKRLEADVYADFEVINKNFLGEREKYENARTVFAEWRPIRDKVVALMLAGKRDEAVEITKGEGAHHVFEIQQALTVIGNCALDMAADVVAKTKETKTAAMGLMYSLLIAAVGVGIIFVILFSRSITIPLIRLRDAAVRIGRGEIEEGVRVDAGGELGELADAFNRMREDLYMSKSKMEEEVAERMHAEKALQNSETNLIKAQEVAHIGSWCLNLLEDSLVWSDENYKIFGVPKGTPVNYEKFIIVVHPEDRDYSVEKWNAAIEGEPYDIEIRLLIGDEVKWVRRRAELSFDDKGHLTSAVGTTQDISERKRNEEALKESAAFLAEAQKIAHIGHWKLDPETKELMGSDEFFQIFGLTRNEATLESFIEVVHPDDRERDVAAITRGIEHGENWDIEHRLICRDGTEKFVHAVGEARTDEYGKTVLLVGTVQDITERKRSDDALKINETKYRLIHDTAFDGIIIADTDSNILEYNRSAEKIFGYKEGELEGRNLTELVPKELPVTGKIVELQGLRKNGEEFPIEIILNSFDLNGNILCSCTIRDITERKQSEESIKHMAYHDHLTGLPNRILFKDRLDQVLLREAWKQRLAAVLFLDLDRFKVINDTLGHAFGDELLKVVARRLEECLREGDTVARIGGDEFTILLQDVAHIDDIPLVLEKVLVTIRQPIEIDGQEVMIGTSIGASIFPADGYDSDTLLKNADTAMYRAKSEGKNCFQLYSAAMSTKANNLLKMEHRLNKALDNGEFTVHYQPQLDLRNNKLIGVEALVRLADQEHDKITLPGEFISVAEETGLIIPLSEWVLRAVCTQNKLWQNAGYPPVTVAVNVSPKVFNQNNFVSMVVDILDETGLKPEYLEIEITEETMMGNTEDTVEKMKALREIGIRFAIDDFGTGYSSLSYIKMLPIDTLKIDKAFVSDLTNNSDDKAIIMATIQMAHSMGIEVLAEGVETKQQENYLRSIGCDKLQGYLFSQPLPHNEFENLLKEAPDTKKNLKDSA
jgi:diguanylate cyclase (GGDEF)-like protein/PAS domain S-box-containing protein